MHLQMLISSRSAPVVSIGLHLYGQDELAFKVFKNKRLSEKTVDSNSC